MAKEINIDELLDNYTNWLRDQYTVDVHEKYTEVNTPFLNSINDNIRLFVTRENGKITLDDDGDTLNNLEMIGIDLNSPQRKAEFQFILKQYGISHPDERLLISGNTSDFPIMKQNLISAIIRVDELSILKKKNVASMFYNDIYEFFENNDFGGLPNYSLDGISGNSNRFDYVIPQLKRKGRPRRLISFQNKLTFENVVLSLYKFNDVIKMQDENTESAIVFNDTNSKINEKIQNAIDTSSTKLFNFSDKRELKKLKLAESV